MRRSQTWWLVFLFAVLAYGAAVLRAPCQQTAIDVNGRKMPCEIFTPTTGSAQSAGSVIVLHGASGPDFPLYRSQAELLAQNGYTAWLPRYFEATGSSSPEYKNTLVWVEAVRLLITQAEMRTPNHKVALLGFSQGASVALAAGSRGVPVVAKAEWYGSLDDEFFATLKTMPPLLILHGMLDTNIPPINAQQLQKLCVMKRYDCNAHFYPNEGHGFGAATLQDADKRTLAFFDRLLKSPINGDSVH